MASEKLAVSFAPSLAQNVRDDANETADGNVSAWLADAAHAKLRQRKLREFVGEYQAEHGAFTDEERAQADALWQD